MKANYKDKIAPQTEISMGNLYDMNKQLMEREPAATPDEIQVAKEQLREYFTHNFQQKYFMLLCHELRDYTMFNLDKTSSWAIAKADVVLNAANDVIECMTNRGELLVADLQDDGAWELWIRNSEGCFAYYFFPYGEAVLEY